MRANVLEIPNIKRESQRKLGLGVSIREAVADHLKHRWRVGTAKSAARAYDLTLDRAREAVAGRASLTTLERIIKIGGWLVILDLGARILGRGVSDFLIEQRAVHNENSRRLGALLGDSRVVSSAPGRDPAGLDLLPVERRQFERRRVGHSDAG